jgi:hypothetical protein
MSSTTTFTKGRAILLLIQNGEIILKKLRYLTLSRDMFKQDRQCTYNIKWWRVRATIFAMEEGRCVLYVFLSYI